MQIGDADAQLVEAQFTQDADQRPVGMGEFDLDAEFVRLMRVELEARLHMADQPTQLVETGAAGVELQTFDARMLAEVAGVQVDFALQIGDVERQLVVRQQRQLYGEGKGALCLAAVAQRAQQVERCDCGGEIGGSRVAALMRVKLPVALHQVVVPAYRAKHLSLRTARMYWQCGHRSLLER